jgi:hypothetical protein
MPACAGMTDGRSGLCTSKYVTVDYEWQYVAKLDRLVSIGASELEKDSFSLAEEEMRGAAAQG